MIKLGYDKQSKAVWMPLNEVKEFYNANKDKLTKLHFRPEFGGANVRLVSLYSGWCTVACENGSFLQEWAGSFICGWQ